jgi:phosphoribulokinase
MSAEHPIIAITGSSGSGINEVTSAFDHILWKLGARGVFIEGNAFHRYDRRTMQVELDKAAREGRQLSHYGPEGNMLDKLDSLFFEYAATGRGMSRHYLHTQAQADKYSQPVGTFTEWKQTENNTDLLLYKGLHGAAIVDDIDIAGYPDLLVGMVPNVNLEWIRKIRRDTKERGYSLQQVRESILRRLPDYVNHITPQFSRTHINFQTISSIDTSDPFNQDRFPTQEECFIVIHNQKNIIPDFHLLVQEIPDAFMSRPDSVVIPGGKLMLALETMFMPLISNLVKRGRELRGDQPCADGVNCGLIGLT